MSVLKGKDCERNTQKYYHAKWLRRDVQGLSLSDVEMLWQEQLASDKWAVTLSAEWPTRVPSLG